MRAFRVLASVVLLAGFAAAAVHAAPAPDNYKLDGVHSYAFFRVVHLGVTKNYGRFDDVSGSVQVADGVPTSLEVTIKAASVNTGNQKRDDHLRGPDFFNAKQFPAITFKSKEIKKADDGTLDVTGDFSLHGVTKSISVKVGKIGGPLKDPWGATRIGGEAMFKIKRSEYGMSFMPEALADDVEILVSLEATKE